MLSEVAECPEELIPLIPSPATGEPGSLTPPRAFNLMFQTQVGAMSDASSTAYLRPETAQGIFVNFKNVQQTARAKVREGMALIRTHTHTHTHTFICICVCVCIYIYICIYIHICIYCVCMYIRIMS